MGELLGVRGEGVVVQAGGKVGGGGECRGRGQGSGRAGAIVDHLKTEAFRLAGFPPRLTHPSRSPSLPTPPKPPRASLS